MEPDTCTEELELSIGEVSRLMAFGTGRPQTQRQRASLA